MFGYLRFLILKIQHLGKILEKKEVFSFWNDVLMHCALVHLCQPGSQIGWQEKRGLYYKVLSMVHCGRFNPIKEKWDMGKLDYSFPAEPQRGIHNEILILKYWINPWSFTPLSHSSDGNSFFKSQHHTAIHSSFSHVTTKLFLFIAYYLITSIQSNYICKYAVG